MEEEYSEHFFVSVQSKPQSEPQSFNIKSLSSHKVTISLIILGFYFLIFAVVQLVNNYQQTRYIFDMQCSNSRCSAQTNFISFSMGNSVYIYVQNSILSQNDISFSKSSSSLTNSDMQKTVSLTGASLSQNQPAYPQGRFTSYYPEATFQIKSISTSALSSIQTADLSFWESGMANRNDLSTQWADVESSRYSMWNQEQIALGINKFWGKTEALSGNYSLKLESRNKVGSKFSSGFRVQLTDNASLDGYNLPFCIFNFIFSFCLFVLGCLSFFLGFGKHASQEECCKIMDTNGSGQISQTL